MFWIKSIVNLWRNRKRETWTELKEGITTITDLPEDVTVDILLRLPVKSVCSIQCVSKTCLKIAGTTNFATLHTMRLFDSDIVELPRFIFLAKSYLPCYERTLVVLQPFNYKGGKYARAKTRRSNLVSKIFFQKYYYSYDVDFVFCNLFLFKRLFGCSCFLVNPLRGEVLKLPSTNNPVPNSNSEVQWYGMGFDNVSRTYKIVHVSASEKDNYVVAQVLELGTSSWRQIHLVPPCDVTSAFLGSRRSKNGIYACGGMHWLIYGDDKRTHGHIISFDFNKEQFYMTLLPDSEGPGFGYGFGVNLLNLRGSLALVDFCSLGGKYVEIWVLKNYDEKKWEIHHRINEKDLQLSNCHLQNCKFKTKTCVEWEHGICFPLPGVCYFLDLRYHSMDLRYHSMKTVKLPSLASSMPEVLIYNMKLDIFSYTDSLISLKNYGNLIEATKSKKASVWHID